MPLNDAPRILYNALQAAPEGAGMGRYTLELARELARLRGDIRFAVQARMAERVGIAPDRLEVVGDTPRSWRRILVEQMVLPRLARGMALAHYPDYAAPVFAAMPSVITIHDLSVKLTPENFSAAQRIWKNAVGRRSARIARRIICPSRYTAESVRLWLGAPADHIRIVHSGVQVSSAAAVRPVAEPGRQPYILCVGTIQPRKTFIRVVEALAALRAEGVTHRLIIAGKPGRRAEDLAGRIHALGMDAEVTILGYCRDEELKWLYEHAALLAYVSLDEGFGFPPLEAMLCGCPVVASRAGAMPEMCGPAARYVDPYSNQDIAAGILEVLRNDGLRQRLAESGRTWARQFDWASAARAVSAIYDEVLAG